MGEANEQSEAEGELLSSETAAEPEPGQSGLLEALLDAQAGDEEGAAPQPSEAPVPSPALRVGTLVAWDAGHGPHVDFPGNRRGPLLARSILPLDPKTIEAAIASGQGVVLQFEDNRPDAPIITGLIQALSPAAEAASPAPTETEAGDMAEAEVELEAPTADEGLEARVDGRRVELEAADEIVLRCGKASIVLRRNGRIVIRGTYVETRSRGVNRIKGGSVEIN